MLFPRFRYRALAALTSLVLVAGAGGCGSEDESSKPTVTATTGIVADITSRVAGDDAEVGQIVPDGSSPHEFQLSAQDRAEIEDSVLLVYNGAGLEAGVPIEDIDVPKYALADNAGQLRPFEQADEHGEQTDEHAEEEHAGEEHEHGAADPHLWMDPTRVATALPGLADALAEADPAHAAGYRDRAEAFATELLELDAEIKSTLSAIPPQDRKLITSHDALGYFADRYGFEVLATPFPASGPEAEASARAIEEVEAAVAASGVRMVFAQETDDPEVLRGIAEDAGVRIEEQLLVEAPGDAGSYVEMLRRDAELIRQGLSAGS